MKKNIKDSVLFKHGLLQLGFLFVVIFVTGILAPMSGLSIAFSLLQMVFAILLLVTGIRLIARRKLLSGILFVCISGIWIFLWFLAFALGFFLQAVVG